MSFQEGHKGFLCPFKASGHLDIPMYQDLSVGIQLGCEHIADNDPSIKDGKAFENADISPDYPAHHGRSGYDGCIAPGQFTYNDLACGTYRAAEVSVHTDKTIHHQVTTEGTIRAE